MTPQLLLDANRSAGLVQKAGALENIDQVLKELNLFAHENPTLVIDNGASL